MAAATLDLRALNRATLARQLLLERAPLAAPEAVRRVLALQAQEPASPYLALWNRVAGLDATAVDAALTAATLVKATLMRVTLHVVHADDLPALHVALQPTLRGPRLGDVRFTASGLAADDADALVPALLEHARTPRTIRELEEWIGDATGSALPGGVWWAVRSYAPLRHAPTGGSWVFGRRPAFVASSLPPAPRDEAVTTAALAVLVRRYLEAFGPATVADVARFTLAGRERVRAAVAHVDAAGPALDRLGGPGGVELLDVPGAPRPDGDVPAPPRLMAMWDSTLLAYAEAAAGEPGAGRVVPAEYRRVVTRSNGDVLPTLLVDGRVAGVWRPVDGGVEVTAFRPLPAAAWDALAEEAVALRAFVAEREPRVYRRYDRWWPYLDGEVRVLPA